MHTQLARDLGVASYRRIPTLSVQGGVKRGSKGKGPSWLDGDARSEVMDEDTAQVTPKGGWVVALDEDADDEGVLAVFIWVVGRPGGWGWQQQSRSLALAHD